MNFSAWTIRNPIPIIVIFLVFTILGVRSFNDMNIEDLPDIQLPIVTFDVAWSGASPNQLETEVVRKIENALADITYLRHIYSTLEEGQAAIVVEFELEKSTSEAIDDVRSAIDSVESELPSAIQRPFVSKLNIANYPIATYVINVNNKDLIDLSWFVDHKIDKTLMQIQGVGKVTRVGGVDREIKIQLDTTIMHGLGIMANELAQTLVQMQKDAPGGIDESLIRNKRFEY